jgi:hypothetical protein
MSISSSNTPKPSWIMIFRVRKFANYMNRFANHYAQVLLPMQQPMGRTSRDFMDSIKNTSTGPVLS